MAGMSYDHLQGDPMDADDLYVTNKAGDLQGDKEGPHGLIKTMKSSTISMYTLGPDNNESY